MSLGRPAEVLLQRPDLALGVDTSQHLQFKARLLHRLRLTKGRRTTVGAEFRLLRSQWAEPSLGTLTGLSWV